MKSVLGMFGYDFERVVEDYTIAFKGLSDVSYTLQIKNKSKIKWSYGHSPECEMRMDESNLNSVDMYANYNIMTHKITGDNKFQYDTLTSDESKKEDDE